MANLYRDFGATLLSFWITLLLLSFYVFYIYYVKLNNKSSKINSSNIIESIKSVFKTGTTSNSASTSNGAATSNSASTSNSVSTSNSRNTLITSFPYLLGDQNMFLGFVTLTFLSLIFSLVHGIYLFAERKKDSYTKKDEKDVLTMTFVGYLFIFFAYLALFLPIIFNLDLPLNLPFIMYGLFMVIGVILISVGLSQVHEKDKKMKNLKSTSIVAPSLISITGLIYGIAPACCSLINIPMTISEIPVVNKGKELKSVLKEYQEASPNSMINSKATNQLLAAFKLTKNPPP